MGNIWVKGGLSDLDAKKNIEDFISQYSSFFLHLTQSLGRN